VPAFAEHVLGVVVSRPKKQVVWIDTKPDITMVQHHRVMGDWANVEAVRNAVRGCFGLSERIEFPIPNVGHGSEPKPTT
jgi:hypothetical protein